MNLRVLFAVAASGLAVGLISAFVSAQQPQAQRPVFSPAPNPYASGIYANGIIESRQSQGTNITIFPDVTGPVTAVLVKEGAVVKAGTPLLTIDDSVQRQATAQQQSQLDVVTAQIINAKASLKSASDTLSKLERVFAQYPGAVSREQLDSQRDAVSVAMTNVRVFEQQQDEQSKAIAASQALLRKYTIRAPSDGVVMSIKAAVGGYVSPQGAYDAYTQGYAPIIVMGSAPGALQVRVYIDEILINRIPPAAKIRARMYVRGTNLAVPLTFDHMQPYVTPKIELSDQRLEQVDVRVLPLIFRFDRVKALNIYPGELVDVYVGSE